MKIQVEAVVFDYGNTLVLDPFEDILKNKIKDFQNVLRKFGYSFSKRKIFSCWNEANREINYPHITHFAQEEPIVVEALKKLNVKNKHINLISKKFLSIYRKEWKIIYKNSKRKKELKTVLSFLKSKGKVLAILSNGRKFDVENGTKWLGVYNYFDFIISSEEIGVEKPDKKAFEYILNKLNKQPEKVVYVGDDYSKDIVPTKKLGMKAILYIPPKKFRKSMPWRNYDTNISVEPDAKIKKLSDLMKIIC
jgi:HAD superfamily hydrolase (TIGR01549 family)